jgi:hypothetical protein
MMYFCFAGETPVLMGDGSQKPIKDVRIGDIVIAEDAFGNRRLNIVTRIFNHGPEEHGTDADGMLKINGHLIVTPEHEIFTNRGWLPAGELRVGDQFTGIDGFVGGIVSGAT